MYLPFLKLKVDEAESLFKQITATPAHIQDILINKYFEKDSDIPASMDGLVNDIRDIYESVITVKEKTTLLHVNPFSGKYIRIIIKPEIKNNNDESSYMLMDQKSVLKRNYFDVFELIIKTENVIKDHCYDDNFTNFKDILYHELAHAHFSNFFTAAGQSREVSADLSAIIYTIKKENLSLEESKKLVDRIIKMRVHSANLFDYVRRICPKRRVHGTEHELILFRLIDEDMLHELKSLNDRDIIRFVYFWLNSMTLLLNNPYSIDFNNKELIKFLFYNNHNPELMEPDSNNRGYIRSSHIKSRKKLLAMFKNRHDLPELSIEEVEIMKGYYLLNVLLDLNAFNDFMTTHSLHRHFNYLTTSLFNQDDYKYAFLDSLKKFEHYKIEQDKVNIDIPYGYNTDDLNNFLN